MTTQTFKLKIVLTGGGTAGHVMPHLALLPEMKKRSWHVFYIGTSRIEKHLISECSIPFYTICAGKLRRYFSIENFLDLFKCGVGFFQSLYYLLRLKPDLVFSKGGYVSVPVCLAAKVLGIPVATHESDVTPGLANKIIIKVAHKIFYSFPQSKKYLPKDAFYIPLPVRAELFQGSKDRALKLCDFKNEDLRPVVLIIGGSQGASRLNQIFLSSQEKFLKIFRVIHLTGKGKQTGLKVPSSYYEIEYAGEELKDFLALADLVVSRAGANSIFEFQALNKPMVLIPLSQGSRGDQVVNAKAFEEKGLALVLAEKDLTSESLLFTCEEALQVLEIFSEVSALEASQEALKNRNTFLDQLAGVCVKLRQIG